MAKKRCKAGVNQESDPESDDEKKTRDDERGRTVLALVGKAIQNNTKIPLQWNHRRVPCGEHRTAFSTYIGVVARERVCINYKKWTDLPEETLDEVYEFITKGFVVLHDRKKWILSRASKRWNAFKTRLRKYWLYKSEGKIRKKCPWKYPWIHQPIWDKFTKTYSSVEFKEISAKFREKSLLKKSSYRGGRLGYQYYEEELERELIQQGIHVTEVPRHLVWLKAHSIVQENGLITFKNPADLEVAEAIKTLMTDAQDGGIRSKGRGDILAQAIKKPERGGHVVAVGSGITNKEYFGYNKPTPPSELHNQIYGLKSEIVSLKNQQNLLNSFIMTTANEEQLKRFTAICHNAQPGVLGTDVNTGQIECFGQLGSTGGNDGGLIARDYIQANDLNAQIGSNKEPVSSACRLNTLSNQGFSFTQLLNGNYGLYNENLGDKVSNTKDLEREVQETQPYRALGPERELERDYDVNLPKHIANFQGKDVPEDIEAYRDPWPELEPLQDYNADIQMQPTNNPFILPEGESDCCLAINGNQGMQIVANGTVFNEDATKAKVHFSALSPGIRRVSILKAIVPNALLPCPTEEWTVVVQALHSFVKWPSHLILPRNTVNEIEKSDKQPEKQFVITSPRPSSSQGSCSRKYVITHEDRARLTTDLLRFAKNEALVMKKGDRKILVPTAKCVSYFSLDDELDYEDMLDWCFQKEIRRSHVAVFMKYLSEKCHKESISGIYGFCDANYLSLVSLMEKSERVNYLASTFGCNEGLNINQTLFVPFFKNHHWMLVVIRPWNGIVWWLNPAGSEEEISQFAQEIINEGIIKFSLTHRKDIKKLKKNPLIKWKKPSCPRKPLSSSDCGFYVCRYMLETISNRHQVIPDQYFKDVPSTYTQEMLDEVRDIWVTFVLKHKKDEEEDDENEF